MRKIFIFIIFLILNYLYIFPVYAQSSSEISISELFNEYYLITTTPEKISNIGKEKSHLAIEYAIEILKRAPGSLEAFCTLSSINGIKATSAVYEKYNTLKNKYFSTLNDINTNVEEKIILVRLTIMDLYNYKSSEEINENENICTQFLQKIISNSTNKNYSALATQILFSNKLKGEEYRQSFKEKFPDHPAIPLVELDIIAKYWENNEQQKFIDEAKKWCEKYPNFRIPNGYRGALSAYTIVAYCYMELSDKENAQKYIDLIEKEAPNYPTLFQLKKENDND